MQRWYNKLGIEKTYESIDNNDKWFLIKLTSHDEEDNNQKNFLTLAFGKTYKVFKLPFQLIKPLYDYSTYDYDGADYYQISHKKFKEMNIPVKYKNYVENNYEFSIFEDSVSVYAGISEFLYNDNKHRPLIDFHWFIPWRTSHRTKNQLLNPDGTLFYDVTKEGFDKTIAEEDKQPSLRIKFKDYGGEENIVTCKRTYSEYSLGNNNKFWTPSLRLFGAKPDCYHNVELNFEKEIGPEKGSWKGGTVGHAVELLDIEINSDIAIEDAFRRYCTEPEVRGFNSKEEHNMTFIEEVK